MENENCSLSHKYNYKSILRITFEVIKFLAKIIICNNKTQLRETLTSTAIV
jgi:hypothetical protein